MNRNYLASVSGAALFVVALPVVVLPVIMLPGKAMAQPVNGPYVSLGAGVDYLLDQTIDASPGLQTPERKLKFDPGFAGLASAGFGFGNGFRIEAEGNYFNDHVKGTNGGLRAGGYEQQYGGMANALFDMDIGTSFYPYIGVGIGGQLLQPTGVQVRPATYAGPAQRGSQTSTNLAYQAIVGVSLPVSYVPGLSVTAEYRFMGLLNPTEAVKSVSYTASGAVQGRGNEKFADVYHNSALLGLRYAFGEAPPVEPAPTPIVAPAPAPSRTYLVFFDWDRAELTTRARTIIKEAAQASTRVQLTRIAVNGYTDLSGTPAYNQRLSVRRAEAVAAELVRNGVPRSVISIQGFGESNPLVPTAKGVREPQNRRVEIILQ
jgi:outer membrane protein OmpA-like peptidoglycan-associated protein